MPEYTPGEWYGVVAGDMAVLLHPRTPAGVVREVFSTLRSGAGLGRPLAALLIDASSDLRPFAAAQMAADAVHTALRGDVAIVTTRSGHQQRRTAAQVVLWTEEHEGPAELVELHAPGTGDEGERLPVAEGVVRASRLVLAGGSRAIVTAADDAVDRPEPGSVVEPAGVPVVGGHDAQPEPAAKPAPVAEPDPQPVAALDRDLELVATLDRDLQPAAVAAPQPSAEPDRDLRPVSTPASPVPVEPDPQTEAPEQLELATVSASIAGTGSTSGLSPAPASAAVQTAPAPAVPGPASQDDHDGMTILSGELASIRQNLPSWAVSESGQWPSHPAPVVAAAPPGSAGAPGALPVPPPAPAAEAFPRLVLSTGVVVPVDGVLLVGRAPQADRAPEGERTRLVAVPSPTQDISRTHAEVRVENGRVLVTDLFSTNGVMVSSGGLPPRKIAAGEAVAVNAGVVVDLGDGVTFTVEPPA